MTAVLLWLGKSTLCLAIGLAALPLLRRASAALRHALLTVAVLIACLMPALAWMTPAWPVLSAPFSSIAPSAGSLGDAGAIGAADALVVTSTRAAEQRAWTMAQWAIALWGAATVLMMLRVVRSRRAVRRLFRDARPLNGAPAESLASLTREWGLRRRVQLLVHPTASLVAVAGVWRPRIVVPAAATAWTRERWQVVLRHELAHVRRWDLLWHDVAELVILAQPWNPLAWLAGRHLRDESEHACDDLVIASGVSAADYATHLLEIARYSTSRFAGHIATSSIAHPSTLERRVHAMLQPRTNHHAMTRTGWALAFAASLIVGLPIASATTAAEPVATPNTASAVTPVSREPMSTSATTPAPAVSEAREVRPSVTPRRSVPAPAPVVAATEPVVEAQAASLQGRIVDASGGTIPGAAVTITNATGTTSRAVTNPTGRFTFSDLQAGPHELTAALPGFKTVHASLTLVGGQTAETLITFEVGALSEEITVACSTPSPLAPLAKFISGFVPTLHAQAAQPIRVGGNVRAPKRTQYVAPACPGGLGSPEVKLVLSGTIDATGKVDVAPAAGMQAPVDAVDAAMDAVRRWEYTPTQLNGKPVAVEITVTIRFVKS